MAAPRALSASTDLRRIPGLAAASRHLQRIGSSHCVVHLVGFDPGRFDVAAYAVAGIDPPPGVERSVRRRQASFLFGRVAAALALAEAGAGDTRVAVGDAGQPVFPAGWVGSITHTSDLAAAAVLPATSWRGLGIDIERPITGDALVDVESTALRSAELASLGTCAALTRPVRAALAFSAKESFYKAVFASVRRVLEYDALQVVALDADERRLRFVVAETIAPEWSAGSTCGADFSLRPDGSVLTAFAW